MLIFVDTDGMANPDAKLRLPIRFALLMPSCRDWVEEHLPEAQHKALQSAFCVGKT